MRSQTEIGLLYSSEGGYALMSEACRKGALAAIEEVNSDPDGRLTLKPVERDPCGNIDLYGPLCAEILRDSSARHVVGCITSWSRKEVIPTLEKADGTLWYACPYEGFEASDRVIYTHACPNQHLLPLLHWAFARFGRRVYLTGSNYIWGWEMNRVAREVVAAVDGQTAGERYLPIGDTGVARMVEEVRVTRPDFILNNLIGASSYAFLRAYAELGREDPHFTAARCPVLSCNLTECELGALGEAAEGLVAAGPFFRGESGWPGGAAAASGSSFEAAAHAAVRALAAMLSAAHERAGLDDLLAQPAAKDFAIDPQTHHMALPVLIAQVRGGAFEVLERFPPVSADPYLSRRERWPDIPRPALSVVK